MNDDSLSEVTPTKHSFFASLRRDTHWKCLILTSLMYGSVGIICWCRLTTVSFMAYDYRGKTIRLERSPCDDGYVYIPVAFLVLIYLVYILECWRCHTRVDLQYKEKSSLLREQIQRMRDACPIVWWHVTSYHYVRRTRAVTRYRNGDTYTATQEYFERVNTHSAVGAFDFSRCGVKDVSKELSLLEDFPATKIKFTKCFRFANHDAENEYLAQRSRFFAEHEGRDEYMENREGMALSDLDFREHLIVFAETEKLPWYISSGVFWALSLCSLSWPLRVLIEFKTAFVNYQIDKLFGYSYSPTGGPRDSMENWNGSSGSCVQIPCGSTIGSSRSLELAILRNYQLAPSYSEALLMDAITGSLRSLACSRSMNSSRSFSRRINGQASRSATSRRTPTGDEADEATDTSPILEFPHYSPPGYDVALTMMTPSLVDKNAPKEDKNSIETSL